MGGRPAQPRRLPGLGVCVHQASEDSLLEAERPPLLGERGLREGTDFVPSTPHPAAPHSSPVPRGGEGGTQPPCKWALHPLFLAKSGSINTTQQ